MERINLSKVTIDGIHIEKLSLFLDSEKNLIVLPFLWSLHMCNTGTVYKWVKVGSLSKYQTKKPSNSQQILENHSIESPLVY